MYCKLCASSANIEEVNVRHNRYSFCKGIVGCVVVISTGFDKQHLFRPLTT